jgi:ribose transport system substrate-binding protein
MFHLRRMTGLAIGALVITLAAACSPSGGSGSSGGGSGAQDRGSSKSAMIGQLEQEPTTIPITTPLPAKPSSGSTFVFLKCEVPQCDQQATAYAAVAEAVGWTLVTIPFVDTDPSTLATAFQQAVALRPVAVNFGGTPYALWSRYIPDFEKIGAIIIPSYIGEAPLSATVPANVAGPVNDQSMAAKLAQWVADDSGGTANVLVQSIGSYNAVVGWAKDFKTELAKLCSGCKTSDIDSSATQISGAGAAQSIVSQIRKDPSIDYFVGYNGAFFSGLNQALKNAQLKVKVGGLFPLPQNVQDVMNGSGGAFLAVSNKYTAWAVFDVALRQAQAAPQVPLAQQVFPTKLVTKDSAKVSDGEFNGPVGFEQQFKTLWKVG